MKRVLWLLAAVVGVGGAGMSAQGNSRASNAPMERDKLGTQAMAGMNAEMVPATTADPSLKTEFDNPSVVAVPEGTPRKELVVLLPGTGGKPAQYSLLIRSLRADGFRVIGLMYNNKPTEAEACDSSKDVECHRHFREERFAGDDKLATVTNTADEGIDHRLVMLLKYLDKEHPGVGWGDFLAGNEPAWKRIIITGHSQGSGHAAYIAKTHEVARVVLFSGPYDGVGLLGGTPELSSWLRDDSRTPADRWYAEYHVKDLGAFVPPLTLAALKVPSDHIFISKLEPATATTANYHGMGTHDPRMEATWKWLFGVEGGSEKPAQ